jgi:hypothetical protein
MGTKATREISKGLGSFPTSKDAWDRRVQSGQNGAGMSNQLNNLGRPRALTMLADWTDRIAKGEVPPAPPRRRAQSATLSSACGIGPTRRRTSTMR